MKIIIERFDKIGENLETMSWVKDVLVVIHCSIIMICVKSLG